MWKIIENGFTIIGGATGAVVAMEEQTSIAITNLKAVILVTPNTICWSGIATVVVYAIIGAAVGYFTKVILKVLFKNLFNYKERIRFNKKYHTNF